MFKNFESGHLVQFLFKLHEVSGIHFESLSIYKAAHEVHPFEV